MYKHKTCGQICSYNASLWDKYTVPHRLLVKVFMYVLFCWLVQCFVVTDIPDVMSKNLNLYTPSKIHKIICQNRWS